MFVVVPLVFWPGSAVKRPPMTPKRTDSRRGSGISWRICSELACLLLCLYWRRSLGRNLSVECRKFAVVGGGDGVGSVSPHRREIDRGSCLSPRPLQLPGQQIMPHTVQSEPERWTLLALVQPWA